MKTKLFILIISLLSFNVMAYNDLPDVPKPIINGTSAAPYCVNASSFYQHNPSGLSYYYGSTRIPIYVNMGDTLTYKKVRDKIFEKSPNNTYRFLIDPDEVVITEFWYFYYKDPMKFMGNDTIVVDDRVINEIEDNPENKYKFLTVFIFNDYEEEYKYRHRSIHMFKVQLVLNQTTSINEIKSNSANYTISNNTIYFENTINNLSLYNIQGKLISQYKNVSEVSLHSLPLEKGIYIVKTDNETFKISI